MNNLVSKNKGTVPSRGMLLQTAGRTIGIAFGDGITSVDGEAVVTDMDGICPGGVAKHNATTGAIGSSTVDNRTGDFSVRVFGLRCFLAACNSAEQNESKG